MTPSSLTKSPAPAPKPKPKPSRAGWLWLPVLAILGFAAWHYWPKIIAASSTAPAPASKGGKKGGSGAVPVVAVKARKGDIGVYITGLGAVTPIYTVTVKSRVDGQLMTVHYKEGDIVQKGDLLVEIDPRPYQVALEQAEGQMARDQATLENARVDLDRYHETARAERHSRAATGHPEGDRGSGRRRGQDRPGADRQRQAEPGLLPHHRAYHRAGRLAAGGSGKHRARHRHQRPAGDHADPAHQRHLHRGRGRSSGGASQDSPPGSICRSRLGTARTPPRSAPGTLATVDNQIDPTTGSLRLRANFDNSAQPLFPNQFVNVRLLVEEKHGVTLVPSAVIQRTTRPPTSTW